MLKTMLVAVLGLGLAACMTVSTPAPADDVRITLERGVCFGACPDYTVTISGDGQVAYEGRRFVRVTGAQQGTASRRDVADLVTMIERAHFFELNDSYRGHVTDLPTYRVTVTQHGRTKTVVDYAGEMVSMPHAVREIEQAIDRAANTAQWVQREGGSPAADK